jgi:restriction system protein
VRAFELRKKSAKWATQSQAERAARKPIDGVSHPAKSLTELLKLNPTQFEITIGDLLCDLGYQNVKHVGGRGDLAVDLTCDDENGKRVLVQCKRFTPPKPVDSDHMQKFIAMMEYEHFAAFGLYVTTSRFTAGATSLAKKHLVTLLDGSMLETLFK